MNFEVEIALLQGSFYCKSSLQKHQVNVAAICHTIREIIDGLHDNRSNVGRHHWNFKLHAIFFYKLLEKRKIEFEEEENAARKNASAINKESNISWNYFDGVSRALPDCVELNFYLDVANKMEWGSLCAQVLLSLEEYTSKGLLEDITSSCIAMGHIDLLIIILTGLLRPSCLSLILNSSTSSVVLIGSQSGMSGASKSSITDATWYSRVIASSCEQILVASSQVENQDGRIDILQSLMECLNDLVQDLHEGNPDTDSPDLAFSKRLHTVKHSPHKLYQNQRSVFPNETYQLHRLSSSQSDRFFNMYEDNLQFVEGRSEMKELSLVAVSKLVCTLHDLIIIGDWKHVFLSLCETLPETETSTPATDCLIGQRALLANRITQLLHNLAKYLDELSPAQVVVVNTKFVQRCCDELRSHLSEMLDKMKVLDGSASLAKKVVVAMEMEEVTNEERCMRWLQEAVIRIDARLEGYQDYLDQMFSSSHLWKEDSWIECLERNQEILALPKFVKCLIDVAMVRVEEETNKTFLLRVVKILLSCFCQLSLTLQNNVRDYLWSYPDGIAVISGHSGGSSDQLTTAFNRLVNLAQGQENVEVLTELSCLALQHPIQTLQQAVQQAVSNFAVCQAVCQVLQAMPSLAVFKLPRDTWPLLYHLINESIKMSEMADNEEANIIQLVTMLLQPYKPFMDAQCPFLMPPILSTRGVTQVCVLSHLKTYHTQTMDKRHVLLSLKLLNEILQCGEKAVNVGSIFGTSSFPIILCLCEILDDCYLLWDGVAMTTMMTQKALVKEVVLGLLGRIGRMVTEMPMKDDDDTEQCISWLMDHVSTSVHWTTALYINQKICLQRQKKLAPKCVFDICRLPDSDWSPIPSITERKTMLLSEQLTELLHCCKVSESLATNLSLKIQTNIATSPHIFLKELTVALVQVLPHCIMGEWQCIMGMLKQLIADRKLSVPCSAQYVMELPMVDIADFRVYLSLSQLLLSVIELLTSPCCQDWVTPQLLHHVTRCYVNTMQTIAADILTSDLCDAPGCLFLIGQLFCHTCEVISRLPTDDLKDQVYVLTLEYLSQTKEIVTGKETSIEWANQRAVLELLTNQKLAGERRRTLQQKMFGFP